MRAFPLLVLLARGLALAPTLTRRAWAARCAGGCAAAAWPAAARARNLPESTGAAGDKRGTVDALAAVARVQVVVDDATAAARAGDVQKCAKGLAALPREEKAFKRVFDEYSDAVDYKTKFMDQNAFLVYYTRGFDGPGRARMEDGADAPTRQSRQFGYRNDAWAAVDDARAEAEYLLAEGARGASAARPAASDDLRAALGAAQAALRSYVELAPAADRDAALAAAAAAPR